jgi:hypothetical protein
VIFTIGFSGNAVIHNGVLDKDVKFLAKPFTFDPLSAKILEVMRATYTLAKAGSARRPHGTGGQRAVPPISNPCIVLTARNEWDPKGFDPAGASAMLMTKERRPGIRTLRGWAISVLQEAGAIKECGEHSWMQDRADPHARAHALDLAREERPPGISPQAAVVAIAKVLESIGDACPECPPG